MKKTLKGFYMIIRDEFEERFEACPKRRSRLGMAVVELSPYHITCGLLRQMPDSPDQVGM